MSNILIIDENRSYCDQLHKAIRKKGYQASRAYCLRDGFELNRQQQVDIVVLNNRLTNGNGITHLLQMFRNSPAGPEVLVLAEQSNPDEAELAIENGAWDYIAKPGAARQVVRPLASIVKYRRARQSEQTAEPAPFQPGSIAGRSKSLRNSLELMNKAARCSANVLIIGETGTGKELFATAIHQQSARAGKSFVVVDCAALPETLVESTLFGHEKGAFTGAVRQQSGLIKQADNGTLFLDEVGELPFSLQKAFLRVLETGRFRPVGSNVEIASDFRLVAATNQDLEKMVRAGKFREDLLFRLRTFTIQLPPLRFRSEDIASLCRFFFDKMSRHTGTPAKKLSDEFHHSLHKYHWPGNVRELFHALERSTAAAAEEPVLFSKHLPTYIRVCIARQNGACRKEHPAVQEERPGFEFNDYPDDKATLPCLQEFRDEAIYFAEKRYLQELAAQVAGDIGTACRISGLSRSRFYALLKKYQVAIRT